MTVELLVMNQAQLKQKFLSSLLILSLAGSLTLFAQQEARAANLFEKAVGLYNKGDHKRAQRYFKHIINNKPDHWQSHYYLADIYLRANELKLARKYYNSCVVNYPDIPTCKNIVKALAHIDKLEAVAVSKPEKSNDAAEDEVTIASDANLSEEDKARLKLASKLEKEEADRLKQKISEAKARRAKIIEEGNREAQAVIAQAHRLIQQLHRESNWHVKNVRTGEVGVGLPSFVANDVLAKAEAKAAEIRRTAQVRARGIHIPRDDMNKTRALAQQLKASPGKSGTRLNHIGTNTYVRNYIHQSDDKKKTTEKRKIATGENNIQ